MEQREQVHASTACDTERRKAFIPIHISQIYRSLMQGTFDEPSLLRTQRGEGEAKGVTQQIINNG